MGNSCFCNSAANYIKDLKVNVYVEKESVNEITEHNVHKEENTNEKNIKGIVELKKYFDLNDKEIMNILDQKEKVKKNKQKKKRRSVFGPNSDNKYELMLKRLLEQKSIKRKGPKRRETIRKSENIKILVNEILDENKNEIKNNNHLKKLKSNEILIKNKNNKVRFSITIDKDVINNINNKLNKKHFKNVNTLNEFINEGNSSGFGKKETNKK